MSEPKKRGRPATKGGRYRTLACSVNDQELEKVNAAAAKEPGKSKNEWLREKVLAGL